MTGGNHLGFIVVISLEICSDLDQWDWEQVGCVKDNLSGREVLTKSKVSVYNWLSNLGQA
jgi:hypothetical protein